MFATPVGRAIIAAAAFTTSSQTITMGQSNPGYVQFVATGYVLATFCRVAVS